MLLDDPAPRRPLEPWQRRVAILLGVAFTGLIAADLVDGYVPAKLSVGFMLLWWVPAIVLHELGHALVARLVGWRVHELVIGVGPPLLRLVVSGTRVMLCAIPFSGYVIPSPRTAEVARFKSALVYLGGPGIELAAAGLLLLLLGADTLLAASTDPDTIAAQSLAVVLTMQAGFNLLPHSVRGAPTDGLGILLSAFLGGEHFRRSALFPHLSEVETALEEGDARTASEAAARGLAAHPDSLELKGLEAVCMAAAGDREAAMARLEALRAVDDVSPAAEATLLHCAARVVLESGEHALLGDAEAACRASLALSDDPEVRIDLGRLQLEQGRFGLATETLMQVYKQVREPRLEDHCLAYLAAAAHGQGNAADAALFRNALIKRMPSQRLLRYVAERVDRSAPLP